MIIPKYSFKNFDDLNKNYVPSLGDIVKRIGKKSFFQFDGTKWNRILKNEVITYNEKKYFFNGNFFEKIIKE